MIFKPKAPPVATVAMYDCDAGTWIRTVRQSALGVSSICAVPDQDPFLYSANDGAVHFVPVQS